MEVITIDGYIGKDDGMSALFGGTPNFSLKSLTEKLASLPAGTKEVTVKINSGGGDVNEGFAIHDALVSSGLAVHTEVLGICGSIATVIALAAKPESRSMHANSEYFIHNPYWQPMSPEAMSATELQSLADNLKSSQDKLLNFYVDKTGQPANTIKTFMDKSTGFTSAEAKNMGFVTNIIGENVATKKYLIAAFIDTKKTTEMDFTPKQKSWIEEKFNAFTEKFGKLLTPTFQNKLIDLESGAKIWIDSADDNITGKSVFSVDDAGNKTTAAPDGEYKTKDGKTIVVKDGVVSEVKDAAVPATAEVDALKKQVAELQTQLTASQAKVTETDKAKAEQEANIVALKKEFNDFKAQILTKDFEPPAQTFKGQSAGVKSDNEKWLAYKKAKAEAAKPKTAV